MTGSVNLAIIQGALGRDPDIRTTQSGGKIANMSIATSERLTDKRTGERQERTEWNRVVVFNDALVNVIERYVKKGSTIYVEGKLQTRKWSDKNGVERMSTEVVLTQFSGVLKLMGSAKGGDDRPARQPDRTDQRGNPQYGGSTGGAGYNDGDEDNIPFAASWQ